MAGTGFMKRRREFGSAHANVACYIGYREANAVCWNFFGTWSSNKGEIDRIEFRAAFGLLTKVLFGRFDGEAPGFESVVRRIRCRHDEPFPCSPVSAVRQCLRGRKRLYVRQQLLQRWAWPFPRTRTRPVSRWASDYRRERRMATENRKAPKGKRQETNKIQPEKLKWHTRTIICVYPLGFVCLLFL